MQKLTNTKFINRSHFLKASIFLICIFSAQLISAQTLNHDFVKTITESLDNDITITEKGEIQGTIDGLWDMDKPVGYTINPNKKKVSFDFKDNIQLITKRKSQGY